MSLRGVANSISSRRHCHRKIRPKLANSLEMSSYAKCVCNPFRINRSENMRLKPPLESTVRKKAGGWGVEALTRSSHYCYPERTTSGVVYSARRAESAHIGR